MGWGLYYNVLWRSLRVYLVIQQRSHSCCHGRLPGWVFNSADFSSLLLVLFLLLESIDSSPLMLFIPDTLQLVVLVSGSRKFWGDFSLTKTPALVEDHKKVITSSLSYFSQAESLSVAQLSTNTVTLSIPQANFGSSHYQSFQIRVRALSKGL